MKSSVLFSLFGAMGALASMEPLTFNILHGTSYHSASKGRFPTLNRAIRNSESGAVSSSIDDLGVFYSVNITLDNQPIEILLDTGSSDLWVISADAKYCEVTGDSYAKKFRKRETSSLYSCDSELSITTVPDASSYGFYDTKDFNSSGEFFYIQYGDYSFAEGTWGTADLGFAGVQVEDLTIAVANITNSTPTVFGIGFSGNEASDSSFMDSYGGAFTYSNLPVALKEQGYIDKVMFSLSMNENKDEGTILFGASDSSGYTGDLVALPMDNIYKDYGYKEPITFNIILEGLTFSDGDSESDDILGSATSVLLDSGTSSLLIPNEAVSYIINKLGAKYNNDYGVYETACSKGAEDISLNYKFNGVEIKAPLSDLLVQLEEGSSQCGILISGTLDGSVSMNILGDPFLRAAYVVYDLENYEISLAQVKDN